MLRIKLLTAAATALLAAPAALAQTAPQTPPQSPPVTTPALANNVIDVLRAQGQFSTLLSALDTAQLTETLATRPAVTVFAPTDAAFAALSEAERTRLLNPANAQELRNRLLYHVIVADVTGAQIEGARGAVPTAGGGQVLIDGTGDAIMVDAATVVRADIDASNGGVYVIDRVLNPTASLAAQGDTDALMAVPPTDADTMAPPATTTVSTPVPSGAITRPARPGETAPNGAAVTTVITLASPPVRNPTDGQIDDFEDPGNPAKTPIPN
jgi:uncharacterized surface protein with fasciclin (FAS1) repeats